MKQIFHIAGASIVLSSLSLAQVQAGDILLNVFGGGVSGIQHYRPNGTQVITTTGGTGDLFEGAVLTDSGLFATSRRSPNGFNLFDPSTGLEVATHDTSTITFVPSDVDVFADGTLVIGDQDGEVELYTEAGVHMGTITHPGITRTFGIHVASNDDLWIGDIPALGVDVGNVFHFARNGTFLGQFATTFEIGDLVVAPNGTIWCADRNHGLVYHLSSTGAVLSSFLTAIIPPEFDGIALASDGTLYVSSGNSTEIYHYDSAGTLLGQFPILGASGLALFLRIVGDDSPGTKYCTSNPTSTGAPADISASGSASSSVGNLTLTGAPVPNQPGIFFHASSQTQVPFGCSYLCATGGLQRGAVVSAAGGVATYTYDNSDTKHSLATFTMQTRNFQYWFRDPMGAGTCTGGATFNTSNAISILVLP